MYLKLRNIITAKKYRKVFKISFYIFGLYNLTMIPYVFYIVPEFASTLHPIRNSAVYQNFIVVFSQVGLLAGLILLLGACVLFALSLYHLRDAYNDLQEAKRQ